MDSSATFDRRQVYRPFLEGLTQSSPGALAARDLLVRPEHDPRDTDEPPIHVAFANAAELNRGIQMALVGGIGSGKTTELWLTRELLKRHKDAINILIDLAEITDLNELNPGAILIAIGLALFARIKKADRTEEIQTAQQKLQVIARGDTKWVDRDGIEYEQEDCDDGPELVPVHTPGLLKPRFPAIQRQVSDVLDLVVEIATPLLRADAQITVLIDGLDRLIQPERFREFAEQDLRAIRDLQITVIVAAPLLLWFDKSRFLQDFFDEVRHIPAAIADPERSTFLRDILIRRGAAELMHEAEIANIARFSGGVLRDLITLARSAAQAAYREDKDRIEASHVDAAVRQLGRRYLVGLGKTQRSAIALLVNNNQFSVNTPTGAQLLVNRQVLEYFSKGRDIFMVHPALAPLVTNE